MRSLIQALREFHMLDEWGRIVESTAGVDREELSRRRYPSRGYYVARELATLGTDEPIEMRSAYNLDGHYIGDPKTAYYLTVKRGILPEKATPESGVCSVGYCKRNGKWYGWSHRAIAGFKTRNQAVRFAKSVS